MNRLLYPNVSTFLILVAVSFAELMLPLSAIAQTKILESLTGPPKPNTQYIPPNACTAVVFYPKKIADDPQLDLIPREIITAWGQQEFGFDPLLINQATIMARTITDLQQPPTWAAVLHFESAQTLAGTMIDRLEKKQLGGKTLYSSGGFGQPSFLLIDEGTMLVGDESYFSDLLAATGEGRLIEIINGANVSGQLLAFTDIESLRPVLNEAAIGMPLWLPPAVLKLKRLPDSLTSAQVGVKLNGIRATTDLVLRTEDLESAEQAGEILTEAMEFGTDLGIGMLAAQMDLSDPIQESMIEYTQRVADELLKKWEPQISGSSVTMHFDEEATALPFLTGMLLPAVQQTRHAARRTQSMNNMRQMTLAMHNYHSATGKFPAQAITDDNGKPLLSWRVAILPYINEQALYDQFHHDEPWDSPHNKKLIAKMPMAYQSPSVGLQPGKTVYLGIAGEGKAFGKEPLAISDITDGSSNTALMVEVDSELAVEWTRPADFEADERNPMQGLGRVQAGGFIASMADGSTQFISRSMDQQTWLDMLTIAGGEIPQDR